MNLITKEEAIAIVEACNGRKFHMEDIAEIHTSPESLEAVSDSMYLFRVEPDGSNYLKFVGTPDKLHSMNVIHYKESLHLDILEDIRTQGYTKRMEYPFQDSYRIPYSIFERMAWSVKSYRFVQENITVHQWNEYGFSDDLYVWCIGGSEPVWGNSIEDLGIPKDYKFKRNKNGYYDVEQPVGRELKVMLKRCLDRDEKEYCEAGILYTPKSIDAKQ